MLIGHGLESDPVFWEDGVTANDPIGMVSSIASSTDGSILNLMSHKKWTKVEDWPV